MGLLNGSFKDYAMASGYLLGSLLSQVDFDTDVLFAIRMWERGATGLFAVCVASLALAYLVKVLFYILMLDSHSYITVTDHHILLRIACALTALVSADNLLLACIGIPAYWGTDWNPGYDFFDGTAIHYLSARSIETVLEALPGANCTDCGAPSGLGRGQ